jgi:hypothetical protein
MGGFDWAGFPLVCEMLGVQDPRMLASSLATIRDELNRQQAERMKS